MALILCGRQLARWEERPLCSNEWALYGEPVDVTQVVDGYLARFQVGPVVCKHFLTLLGAIGWCEEELAKARKDV